MKEKRYSVVISVYVYAETDEKAIKEAKKLVDKLGDYEDNYAGIESIHETPFASMNKRKVEL